MPLYCARCGTRLDDKPGFTPQDQVRTDRLVRLHRVQANQPCPQCGSTARRASPRSFDYTGNARIVYTAPDFFSRVWHVATSAAAHPEETTIVSARPTDTVAPPPATAPAPAPRQVNDPTFLDPKFKLAYRALLVILSIAFVAMAFGWLIDDRAVALAEKVILLAVGAFIGLVTGKSI